ncbi:MAG: nucleotidyltransferase family protein, partial [Acidobacteriota bacterium]
SSTSQILPFKGPLLALQAYGDISMRRFGDLDVLVKPKHFKAAVDLLSANGFVPLNEVSWVTDMALT